MPNTSQVDRIRDMVSELAQNLYRESGYLLFYGFLLPERGRLEMISLRSASDDEAVEIITRAGEGRPIAAWGVAYEATLAGSTASRAEEESGETVVSLTAIAGADPRKSAKRTVLMHFGDRGGNKAVIRRDVVRRRLRPPVDVTDDVVSPFTGLFTAQ